jgi:hypothetical protein
MLNENAKAWVAALRSGEYAQTEGVLTRIRPGGGMSHCCLGVACELAKEAGLEMLVFDGESEVFEQNRSYNDQKSVLPLIVEEWLGLSDESGSADRLMEGYTSLAELNDTGAFSFEDIADIIESEPVGLFR